MRGTDNEIGITNGKKYKTIRLLCDWKSVWQSQVNVSSKYIHDEQCNIMETFFTGSGTGSLLFYCLFAST